LKLDKERDLSKHEVQLEEEKAKVRVLAKHIKDFYYTFKN